MDKQKILVVDDDPVIGLSCKRILGGEGFTVFTVEDGESAAKKIAQEEFDLVITDIRLPDVYGLSVIQEAKAVQPRADVVVITGYPSLEDAKESIRLGAFEYLEKPFTPDFMLNVARRVFDKRGWILKKAYIDQFKEYIVPASDMDNFTVYYKDGAWARPLKDGAWELGVDVRHFLVSGQLLYVDIMRDLKALVTGEPFAKLLSGDGNIYEVKAPMTGVLKEVNDHANDAICSLVKDHLCEGWFLWLARINPIKG
ncbi:MAG: response regulator [Alphaproteobacteria bacterium]|uniref:Response regulator n=1 Tax=Candidatus Nitrobium versatile TaxID=2884831 RepID=A0A953J7I3_9BACT|nr:response regulator [Candidatus Nitrobium versatile]